MNIYIYIYIYKFLVLVKGFWTRTMVVLNKDNFYKGLVKVSFNKFFWRKNDNNLLFTFKKH
jgi:hypothetical protein